MASGSDSDEPGSARDGDLSLLAGVVRRNIGALAELRQQFERSRTWTDRIADAITAFAGSMAFVIVHAVVFGGWIVVNMRLVPGVPAFDPFPFVMLAMIASVESIFLGTFILIRQNRAAALSSRRDELDVQISLLAEHEVTRLMQMMEALLRFHGIAVPAAAEVDELEKTVDARLVVKEIEKAGL